MQEPAPRVASLLDFCGKTVVVTGASAGIGAGIARRFSEAGANVVINYRSDRAGAGALAQSLGGNALAFHADITDQASVDGLMQAGINHFGRLDALINNAALQDHGALMELPGETFENDERRAAVTRAGFFAGRPSRCRESHSNCRVETE